MGETLDGGTTTVLNFPAGRITVRSELPFDVVVDAVRARFASFDQTRLDALVEAGDASGLEAYVRERAGGNDFTIFYEMDQGRGMTLLGVPARSWFCLLGNPLTAKRLFELEPAAGLVAPLRLCVSQQGSTTRIDYDRPSDLVRQFPSLAESPVGPELDHELHAHLLEIVGGNA